MKYLTNLIWCQYSPNEEADFYWQVKYHMQMWSLHENKMGFIPRIVCVTAAGLIYRKEATKV